MELVYRFRLIKKEEQYTLILRLSKKWDINFVFIYLLYGLFILP